MNEEQIFHDVLAQNPADRSAYLDRVCAGDSALRASIEALLRANVGASGFLLTADHPSGTEVPGTQIGPYKLLEQIGEGGFGVVFMAEQTQPVRRKVALKILKPGMDSRQVIARFEAERQALAIMDHPNIAKVYDGGATPTGRPYFVMELVKGVPITEFCDQNHLTPRQRLELFISVCLAVQHAHQKGIIHRDLKPSNVLVVVHDTKPVVKVIDFGVAKALGQELTDKTLFTGFAQMIGTPLYMSPEQAGKSGLDIDTRSDIYSLGVLLYELLTGTTPFSKERFQKAAYDEIRRIIREEEPSKPSTKLSTADCLPTVAANRGTEPAKLTRLMRGELDWIVMKSLEKDRSRRYETANGFAADVQRYLAGEAVLAVPPSVGYRLRNVVRRNRGPVLAASVVMLVMMGGIIGTTWGMVRANRARAEAVNESVQKETALQDRDSALAESRDRLFTTLVQQARAARTSGRVGQRYDALAALHRAAAIRVTPELRAEAAAALVQPDAVVQEWAGWPEGSLGLVFDSDYRRYARYDRLGEITVGQIRDGKEEVLYRLPVRMKMKLGSIGISPDGRHLAYDEELTEDNTAARMMVWKIDGSTREKLFEESDGISRANSFHPNGRLLAIGHTNGTVSVYDLTTTKRVSRHSVGVQPDYLDFHPRDGRLAVVGSGVVKVFDTESGRELASLPHGGARVYSAAWHPNGRVLATGADNGKIRLWDTETATEFAPPLEALGSGTLYVGFNRAGDRIRSHGWGNTTTIWDVPTGRRLLTLPLTRGGFGPDGRIVGFETKGEHLRVWRISDGQELRIYRERKELAPGNLTFPLTDTTGHIFAASNSLRLNFYDLESGKELASVLLPHRNAFLPIFSLPAASGNRPDDAGSWITGGYSGVHEWPTRSDPASPGVLRVGPPRLLVPEQSGTDYSSGTGFSPDGRLMAVPQGNETLLLDRARPGWRLVLSPQYDARTATISPDGRLVATCSWWTDNRMKSVKVWDASNGNPVKEMLEEGLAYARFSPNGRWLITSSNGVVQLWDVETWRVVRRYEAQSFAFSSDQRLLAIDDISDGVRLIELETWREVARLTGPDPGKYSPLCFTPDGARLIASGTVGLYVWDLRLIRRQLKDINLDWEWPEFPPESSVRRDPVRSVEVDLGELGRPDREKQARDNIAWYRQLLAKNPDVAKHCNNLAWMYATAPKSLRDVKAAIPLAEKAVRLAPKNAVYLNTLGVAYYRAGQYHEAANILKANLKHQEDKYLAIDLYFLAMSLHRLGETVRAQEYFDWAVRWMRTPRDLSGDDRVELAEFRAEAEQLFLVEAAPYPREKK